jgi:hypothetical protein
LARSGQAFPSIEELQQDPRVRARTERERTLHLVPLDDERERVTALIKPGLSYLEDFAERFGARSLSPRSRATSRPVMQYAKRQTRSSSAPTASALLSRIFDLQFRLRRAPTREHLWATVEDICDLHRRVSTMEDGLLRQREARQISGLEHSPKQEAAAALILVMISRGTQRWPEVELAGINAGHSKKTLRNARDWLRTHKRIERAGNTWQIKTSDA